MKNLKILPKLFLKSMVVLTSLVLLIHGLVYLIFPQVYLTSRQRDIQDQANQIVAALEGQEQDFVDKALEVYSQAGDIQMTVKADEGDQAVAINPPHDLDLSSHNNSLLIEERSLILKSGRSVDLQFISTADMQAQAKKLTLSFLPYSLSASFLASAVIAWLFARGATRQIQAIQATTQQMRSLDRQARLDVDSKDEVGQLKEDINQLYTSLLGSMDDLKVKNQEIIELERLKYDFFRGASHDLKTPLASLKITLENMAFKIGKYQDRDTYIKHCIDIVDDLSYKLSQMLSLSSVDYLNEEPRKLVLADKIQPILDKYRPLIQARNLIIQNSLSDESLVIGPAALNLILSNILSNAVKYGAQGSKIVIGSQGQWFYISNKIADLEDHRKISSSLELDVLTSHGMGLRIIENLMDKLALTYQIEEMEDSYIFSLYLEE